MRVMMTEYVTSQLRYLTPTRPGSLCSKANLEVFTLHSYTNTLFISMNVELRLIE